MHIHMNTNNQHIPSSNLAPFSYNKTYQRTFPGVIKNDKNYIKKQHYNFIRPKTLTQKTIHPKRIYLLTTSKPWVKVNAI